MIRRTLLSPVFGGLLGGGVVAAVLFATGVAGDPSTTTTVVRQAPISRPAANGAPSQGLTAQDIYTDDGPGVVEVTATIVRNVSTPFDLFPQQQRGQATGSGFVIDKQGRILTNAHVIDGASKVTVQFGNDKVVDAKVIGVDRSTDLALLQVPADGLDLHPLPLGSAKSVHVGDPVIALGNPYGLRSTLSQGVISAIQREIRSPNGYTIDHVLQTDAAINPGNSGGPLIDAAGRVIGINSQIETDGSGDGNVGIGFAIPIDTAKEVLPELKSDGHVERSYLGIVGTSIDQSLSALNLAAKSGVLVQKVYPGSPADKAGLQGGDTPVQIGDGQPLVLGGDVIRSIDGKDVKTMEELVADLAKTKPGDTVKLGILRDGHAKTLDVELGKRPESSGAR